MLAAPAVGLRKFKLCRHDLKWVLREHSIEECFGSSERIIMHAQFAVIPNGPEISREVAV